MRQLLLLAVLVVVAPAGATGATGGGYANPQLIGNVGPGFSITLTDAAGAKVTHLDPGTYDIVVDDQSEEHNFHLKGPGVDKATEVTTTSKTTWTVTFTDGTYTFQCDPHSLQMHGSFTVGTPPTTTTTSPVPKLVGTVGPAPSIKLTKSGVAVKRLKAGRYDVTVRDRSSSHDFHLVGPGVNRKTGVAFKGTVTWKVTLRKGTLRYLCDPHAKVMRGSVTVF